MQYFQIMTNYHSIPRKVVSDYIARCQVCMGVKVSWLINTPEAKTKWQPFRRRPFKCIFLNENIWILINISQKFVPKRRINNISALVQIMAWCRLGNKPLSDPMMVSLLTHNGLWEMWHDFKRIIFKLIIENCSSAIHCEIALRWKPQHHWWEFYIGSGNGLVPSGNKRWQGVTLTHWGKMAAILQTIFSNAFPRMKTSEFQITFHWNVFLGV